MSFRVCTRPPSAGQRRAAYRRTRRNAPAQRIGRWRRARWGNERVIRSSATSRRPAASDSTTCYVLITEPKRSDVKMADAFTLSPGSIVAMISRE